MSAPMKKAVKKNPTNGKSTGARYTENKKEQILAWIKAYNKGHGGRGGEHHAALHFQVSGTAIRGWLGKLNKKEGATPRVKVNPNAKLVKRIQKMNDKLWKLIKGLN